MQPENSVTTDGINYKKKYKTLKRKLRMLIYEQECFTEELRRAQRKLLRISRDKSFLLDRLLQYEKPEQNGSDSEATASSDSETEHQPPSKKKKITIPMGATTNTAEGSTTAGMMTFQQPPKAKSFQKPSQAANLSPMPHVSVSSTQDSSSTKKKVKVQKKQVAKSGMKVSTSLPAQTIIQQSGSASANLFSKPHIVAVTSPTKQGTIHVATRSLLPGQPAQTIAMTQEELERHLELKQSTKPQFMSIEKTPMLPDNIFSNENSNSCEFPDSKTTDDEDLVIDIP